MRANGRDAVLPQIAAGSALGEGYVPDATYLSVDNGTTWTRISGVDGDSFFEDVTVDEGANKIIFSFANGTTLEVPYVKDFLFAFDRENAEMAFGAETTVGITQAGVVSSQIIKPDGWKASIEEELLTVRAPEIDNKYADTEGDIAVIAVSKGGYTTIAKLHVSILQAAVTAAATPAAGTVEVTFTPNDAAAFYRVYKEVVAAGTIADLNDEQLAEFINQNYDEYTSAETITLPVPSTLAAGDEAAIVSVAYDQRNEAGVVTRCLFTIPEAQVRLSLLNAYCLSLQTLCEPNEQTGYYLQWIGLTSALEAYDGDPASDPASFASYLAGKPEGTITTRWEDEEDDRTWKNLTPDTEYTLICIPVDKRNSTTPNGPVSRLDMKTLPESDAPQSVVGMEIVSSDWLYTAVNYTVNDATTRFYCIAISQEEWNAYRQEHPDETAAETIIAQGLSYSSSRTVTWETQQSTPIYLLAVGVNELSQPGEVLQIAHTTPAYVEGTATVEISVSDVTATSAKSICTPSSDAVRYYQKLASDTQWSNIAQSSDYPGGIYEYVCREGYPLTGIDNYTWTAAADGLQPDTDYTIYCVAVDAGGNYGKMASARFRTTEAPGEDTPEYRQFIGSWQMNYTDYLTKQTGTMQVEITQRVVGKSYNVSGLMTAEYVSRWGVVNSAIEARFDNGKLYLYANSPMADIGSSMLDKGYDFRFCGFTTSSSSGEPVAYFNPEAGFVGTYDNEKIRIEDNGNIGEPYTLQGYCWLGFVDGEAEGRVDGVIPVGISFEKRAANVQTQPLAPYSRRSFSAAHVVERRTAGTTAIMFSEYLRAFEPRSIIKTDHSAGERPVKMTRLR